jgi:hypothetical protein
MRILPFVLMISVVTHLRGQTDATKHFCQGCCGGVGIYYLKLDSKNGFELYYVVGNTRQDNSVFGFGTYSINDNILTLTSENIPQDGVESIKIKDSKDSLIVHFYIVDNVRGDSVSLINVKLKSGLSLFYASPRGTIKTKFRRTEIIGFSSLGFNEVTCSYAGPGEYKILVRLNPEGKTKLKQGDKKNLE